jgi:hypothetical protein
MTAFITTPIEVDALVAKVGAILLPLTNHNVKSISNGDIGHLIAITSLTSTTLVILPQAIPHNTKP